MEGQQGDLQIDSPPATPRAEDRPENSFRDAWTEGLDKGLSGLASLKVQVKWYRCLLAVILNPSDQALFNQKLVDWALREATTAQWHDLVKASQPRSDFQLPPPSPERRWNAVNALTRKPDSEVRTGKLIWSILYDPAEKVRTKAVKVLVGQPHDPELVAAVLSEAIDADPEVRVQVIGLRELGKLGVVTEPVRRAVTTALNRRVGSVRDEAIKTARQLGWEGLLATAPQSEDQSTLAVNRETTDNKSELDAKTVNQGGPMPSPQGLAQQLLAGLPAEEEQRLAAVVGRLDEFRSAIREEVERYILDYIRDRNPPKREERERSIGLINAVLQRLGFAVKYEGQQCYFTLSYGRANPQGQIRLLPVGSRCPLDFSAYLSHFSQIQIIDAAPCLDPVLTQLTPSPSASSIDVVTNPTRKR